MQCYHDEILTEIIQSFLSLLGPEADFRLRFLSFVAATRLSGETKFCPSSLAQAEPGPTTYTTTTQRPRSAVTAAGIAVNRHQRSLCTSSTRLSGWSMRSRRILATLFDTMVSPHSSKVRTSNSHVPTPTASGARAYSRTVASAGSNWKALKKVSQAKIAPHPSAHYCLLNRVTASVTFRHSKAKRRLPIIGSTKSASSATDPVSLTLRA